MHIIRIESINRVNTRDGSENPIDLYPSLPRPAAFREIRQLQFTNHAPEWVICNRFYIAHRQTRPLAETIPLVATATHALASFAFAPL